MSVPIVRSYEFGPFRLDPVKRLLRRNGETVPLTPKAVETLVLLVQHRDRLLEKEELIKLLWPHAVVEEGNLTVNISLLRKALGEEPSAHQYVMTVPGRGYRFVATVREVSAQAEAPAKQDAAEVLPSAREPVPSDSTIVAAPPRSRVILSRSTLLLAGALAVLTLLVWLYVPVQRNPGIDSLAVLPFANTGGDPDIDYLSEGIPQSLVNTLSQLPDLKVISVSSVLRYKKQPVDPQAVGLELGVRAVLVGKVVQRGDELSISAELVDARDKRQIWGEQYNRKPADILDVQDEISREILQKLRLKLSGDVQKRLAKQYTASIEAYQAYLKGRYYWNQRTEEKLEKGLWWFNQAIKHDPNYALAFVGVADSYNLLARYGPRLAKEALPQSEAAAKRALELDDSLAEAHASLGFAARWHDWDWARMEREFTRAIELNPQYAPAHHWYALMYLAAMGRQQEAIRAIKRAQELEPLTPIINTDFGRILYLGRRYDEAIEQLRKTLDLHPDFGMAHFWLGSVYEQKHMYEEAMAAFQQALRFGAFESRAALAHVHAVAGKKAEAHQALEALKDLSRQRYVPSYDIAMIYLGLGDHDRAFDWLQRAVDERYGLMAFLKVEPQFDPLRPDPRFAALVRQVRLAD